jgi:hypothetical protein
MCPAFSKTKQNMQFGTFIDSYKHTTLQWTMSINLLLYNELFLPQVMVPRLYTIQPFQDVLGLQLIFAFSQHKSTAKIQSCRTVYKNKNKSIYVSVLPMKQRACFSGFISINIECQNMIVEIILDSPLGMLHYQPQILQEVLAVHRAWQVGRSSAT